MWVAIGKYLPRDERSFFGALELSTGANDNVLFQVFYRNLKMVEIITGCNYYLPCLAIFVVFSVAVKFTSYLLASVGARADNFYYSRALSLWVAK